MEKAAENVEIAVLGGVGFNSYREFESQPVHTPYGGITTYFTTIRRKRVDIGESG